MTNLTEQWKKGELINGKKYYITFSDSEPFEATFRAAETIFPFWNFEANGRQYSGYDCIKVIAEVPSYELWKAVHEQWKVLLEENVQLKSKLQLKETAYDFDTARLEEENTKLKELLKECKERLIYCTISTQDVQAKINQALGEAICREKSKFDEKEYYKALLGEE